MDLDGGWVEQITTVCVFGTLDPELLCHAHANNARVTFGESLVYC